MDGDFTDTCLECHAHIQILLKYTFQLRSDALPVIVFGNEADDFGMKGKDFDVRSKKEMASATSFDISIFVMYLFNEAKDVLE